ncbi:hypothetical protein EHZ19_24120 [Paraburkholderia bannensis]|nr:hypothetical protein [Paraburkholderia bannensis]RQM45418.1 hypothetical protein EHZ19_24120 [Paraburkholderia bannensis]
MSVEIISGLIGGYMAPFISKFLGRFRLWKVFVGTVALFYFAFFIIGLLTVGLHKTVSRFVGFFDPFVISVVCGVSLIVTFVALLGSIAREAERKKQSSGSADKPGDAD